MSRCVHIYLRGFVIDAGDGRDLCLFGPMSLQIGSDDGIQGQGPADGGPRRASCGPVGFSGNTNESTLTSEITWVPRKPEVTACPNNDGLAEKNHACVTLDATLDATYIYV